MLENNRDSSLWKAIHVALLNENYANDLLEALWEIRYEIGNTLTPVQLRAVHDAYDHMIIFKALGFNIKGHSGDNVNMITDIMTKYFDSLHWGLTQNTIQFITLQIME